MTFKKATSITGIAVMLIASIVYLMTVERTGSLWDCGEFILGAHKLQVVHPPGASLFILIGRMFTWGAEIVSDTPSDIAFSINIMSGLCTAAASMFAGWVAMIMGKISLVGRTGTTSKNENILLMFAGLAGGLSTAFATSIWFSAVEGEVYAMSTFFTAMTFWAAVKWYNLPDEKESDRWLVFSLFSAGLSVGVHLLSLLALPAIGLLYYFKKYENPTIKGGLLAALCGGLFIAFIQKMVIVGVPSLWQNMELLMVNSFGAPFHSGLVPTILIIGGLAFYLIKYATKKKNHLLQIMTISVLLIVIASATVGIVVIRANADTPINMNAPTDAMRLIPYLNREQYGERPMLKGPTFAAETPKSYNYEDRYGRVGDRYEVINQKISVEWNERDMILFPRIGHQDRKQLHGYWRQHLNDTGSKPSMLYNLKFLFTYQINWMYWRYFMWNFAGRQNFKQGIFSWEKKDGNWISGITALDEARLYNTEALPDTIKNDQSRNKYYLIPVLMGLIGLLYQASKSKKEFIVMLLLFLLTGLGIIIYSNQPPQEPRERDYVLVGSFMAFAIWIGLGAIGLYKLFKNKVKLGDLPAAITAGVLVMIAPLLMGFQNFDDNDRSEHYASRDYASNFLNSVDENAIIFTYGDNDTYPLWYAQEVEGIRTDVRVVNISLIAVDWYINKLGSKVNNSPAINLTITKDLYRGKTLNQVSLPDVGANRIQSLNVFDALKLASTPSSYQGGYPYWPSRNVYIPIDATKYKESGQISDQSLVSNIPLNLGTGRAITKDVLAIMDVVASNINDRPIYFSVTCRNEKLLGMNNFMQMEGLGLRIIPVNSTSDPSFPVLYGSGRIDANKAYTNIMERWRWGNFNTHNTYVNSSYRPELQAMKYVMLRTVNALENQGDSERAAALANKFFEAFPNYNFPYDNSSAIFIQTLIRAEKYEDAKREIRILAEQSRQYMAFFNTLNPTELSVFDQGRGAEVSIYNATTSTSISLSKMVKDSGFEQEIKGLLGQYVAQ